jgi:rhamnose utilization protein RhaD (predicted bifunctional aldolase and dehydrogenase)
MWIICIPIGRSRSPLPPMALDKMEEFNREFGHKLVWLPWQRPGFELAMMLKRAVEDNPGCDGIVLGGHGLFTWGETQRESYLRTRSR